MSKHLERGNKLWESHRMFLPEHKQALTKKKKEQQVVDPPLLDEDKMEQLNWLLLQSITYGYPITITYFTMYGPEKFIGKITKIHQYEKWLQIVNDDDTLILEFKNVLDCELMEEW